MPYHVTLLDAAGLEVEAWAVDGDGRRVPNFVSPWINDDDITNRDS